MKTMQHRLFVALLASGLAAFACSEDDKAPSDVGGSGGKAVEGSGGKTASSGGAVNTGSGGKSTPGGGTNGGGAGGSGGAPVDNPDASRGGTDGGDVDASTGAGGADPDPDCFKNPTTHFEIINACTTAERFDKTVSLPLLLPDGGLPELK